MKQQDNNKRTNSQISSLDKRMAAMEAQDNFATQQVDKKLYQAVFLTSNQTYFAKITNIIVKSVCRMEFGIPFTRFTIVLDENLL